MANSNQTDIYQTHPGVVNYYSLATIKTSQTGSVVYGAIGTVNTGAYNSLVQDRMHHNIPPTGNYGY